MSKKIFLCCRAAGVDDVLKHPLSDPPHFFALRINWIKICPGALQCRIIVDQSDIRETFLQSRPLRSTAFQILCASCFCCTYTVYMGYFISQYELYTDFSGRITLIFGDLHKKRPFHVKIRHIPSSSANYITPLRYAALLCNAGVVLKKKAGLPFYRSACLFCLRQFFFI